MYFVFAIQTVLASILGIWMLYKWNRLLLFIAHPEWRKRAKIVLLTCCFYAAFQPANYGWVKMSEGIEPFLLYGGYLYISTMALGTAMAYGYITKTPFFKHLPKLTQQVLSFMLVVIFPMLIELAFVPITKFSGRFLLDNLSFTLWAGCLAGTFLLFFDNYTSAQQIQLQQKEVDLFKLQQLNTQNKLDALQAKINPHFLYNTLNAMAGLALEDGARTSKMAVALSVLFRYNLNRENQVYSTVEEEVEMTQHYLNIEKIRFEENLQFAFDINPNCTACTMPRFLLQPLVENCIKHGFQGVQETGKIKVRLFCSNNRMTVEVADNGTPFAAELNVGFGLQGIQDKLSLLYPNQFDIDIQNDPKKITIQFPCDAITA